MKKLIVALSILLLLSGCSTTYKPGLGSYADSVTTLITLNSSDFVEANPLVIDSSPVMAAVSALGIKHGMKHVAGLYAPEEIANKSVETSGMVAAGWNVGLLIGLNPAGGVVLGAVSGYLYWIHN